MDTVSFPAWWQRKWGTNGAIVLAYLVHMDNQSPGEEWFTADANGLRESLRISPQALSLAREKLKADQAIEFRRVSPSYEYRINYAAIEAEKGQQ